MDQFIKQEWIDFTWFATDRDGCVAAFFTNGDGPFPSSLAPNPESMNDFEATVDAFLESLPSTGECELVDGQERTSVIGPFCRSGIFVYDWVDSPQPTAGAIGGYQQVGRPTSPLNLRIVLPMFAHLVTQYTFSLRFSDVEIIRVP